MEPELDPNVEPDTPEVPEGDTAEPTEDGDTPPAEPTEPEFGEGATKAINRQHYQFQEERRRADALQAQVDALQQAAPQVQRPDVPPIPDQYDEDYDVKIAAHVQGSTDAAAFDRDQAVQQTRQQDQQNAAGQAQLDTINKSISKYSERAESLGLTPQQVQLEGQTVQTHGLAPDLQLHILADDKGPLITSYLAKNPQEIEALRNMSVIQAGIHVSGVIKTKALAASGRSAAPPPVDGLDGGGAPPAKRGPKGTTYS